MSLTGTQNLTGLMKTIPTHVALALLPKGSSDALAQAMELMALNDPSEKNHRVCSLLSSLEGKDGRCVKPIVKATLAGHSKTEDRLSFLGLINGENSSVAVEMSRLRLLKVSTALYGLFEYQGDMKSDDSSECAQTFAWLLESANDVTIESLAEYLDMEPAGNVKDWLSKELTHCMSSLPRRTRFCAIMKLFVSPKVAKNFLQILLNDAAHKYASRLSDPEKVMLLGHGRVQ
jgi:hypothetical protein